MFIVIAVTLAIGVFALSVALSSGRRTGLLDLGSVSTRWLSEHREYQEGGRSQ
jgi:hypothetical protein